MSIEIPVAWKWKRTRRRRRDSVWCRVYIYMFMNALRQPNMLAFLPPTIQKYLQEFLCSCLLFFSFVFTCTLLLHANKHMLTYTHMNTRRHTVAWCLFSCRLFAAEFSYVMWSIITSTFGTQTHWSHCLASETAARTEAKPANKWT